jgi:hypothetical protein
VAFSNGSGNRIRLIILFHGQFFELAYNLILIARVKGNEVHRAFLFHDLLVSFLLTLSDERFSGDPLMLTRV